MSNIRSKFFVCWTEFKNKIICIFPSLFMNKAMRHTWFASISSKMLRAEQQCSKQHHPQGRKHNASGKSCSCIINLNVGTLHRHELK